jgi:hypothetical protein
MASMLAARPTVADAIAPLVTDLVTLKVFSALPRRAAIALQIGLDFQTLGIVE